MFLLLLLGRDNFSRLKKSGEWKEKKSSVSGKVLK